MHPPTIKITKIPMCKEAFVSVLGLTRGWCTQGCEKPNRTSIRILVSVTIAEPENSPYEMEV
jgi:hypothetical protein